MSAHRLLAGPDPRGGAERLWEHTARLGQLPRPDPGLVDLVERSGLQGRGGAWFPAGVKWRAVAQRAAGGAVVLANGAEGEPLSWKDRTIMTARPHLVWDGAFLAAGAVGADQVVLYTGETHGAAPTAMATALAERPPAERRLARLLAAPPRYTAGEESAAVHFVNQGVALPTTTPPRPFERGVGGRPTLVQNVETLAHVAMVARFGHAPRTSLVSVSGAVGAPGLVEVELGTSVADAVTSVGGAPWGVRAVIVGGFAGSFFAGHDGWALPLEPAELNSRSSSLGVSAVAVLGEEACGVCETAAVMRYLAAESAAQCGPCFFGLRALADACTRISQSAPRRDDLQNLSRWAAQVRGRGACHHPDGAVGMLRSALEVFAPEFAQHRPHGSAAPALELGRVA